MPGPHRQGISTAFATRPISSGNKGFSEKKAKFAEHTGLFLNKWFSERPQWTELEILERGERLADLAVARWAGLEAI
ncbi:DUF1524 domain-containing protein [Paracoccaceae bacterium Fryx2]|nr:DUF1524 domain-containing protein [Paracoccaceae bacterium Fryx2]